MGDFYVFDPQEFDALQAAFQQLEQPTQCQYSMAILPPLYIILCNMINLYIYMANLYYNTPEITTSTITTCLIVTIIIVELLTIAFRHHQRFRKMREFMECILCISMIQLIASTCFVLVLEANKKYDTYIICMAILSFSTTLFMIIPFCTDMFYS